MNIPGLFLLTTGLQPLQKIHQCMVSDTLLVEQVPHLENGCLPAIAVISLQCLPFVLWCLRAALKENFGSYTIRDIDPTTQNQ